MTGLAVTWRLSATKFLFDACEVLGAVITLLFVFNSTHLATGV
jgi:hypothetical protein